MATHSSPSLVPPRTRFPWPSITTGCLVLLGSVALAQDRLPPAPAVEVEEDVYTYVDAQNGAGPMWCYGSTCLVRLGEQVFASGLETVPGARPLNNCRWVLFERKEDRWQRMRTELFSLTREPSPLAGFGTGESGRVFLSAHPALNPDQEAGEARSEIIEFPATDVGGARRVHAIDWGGAKLTEHSYRSFAADGRNAEMILFVNSGNWGAHWSFMDRAGIWSMAKELRWPWGATYETPQPVRICYPNVMLKDGAVYFCGVSDIIEPKKAWREFKKELTGKEWDYDFRRLFYIRAPNIRNGLFGSWVEVASREDTCGWISPGDLWVDDENRVHLVWHERAIDERLRPRFFPAARQSYSIRYARLRNDEVQLRRTLVLAEEGGTQAGSKERPASPRFQITPDQRMFVVYYVGGTTQEGEAVSENRLLEILPNGQTTAPVKLPLQHPLDRYFTATPRAGSPLSNTLDMLGTRAGKPLTISYARVRLLP